MTAFAIISYSMTAKLSGEKRERVAPWYRIDNSAAIYPMSITETTQSIFRFAADLDEFVDEQILEDALTDVLPRFPSFRVQLRAGLFRHYFDHNEGKPVVRPDNGVVLEKIDFFANNFYLFRVRYYRKRISVDFFHGLCDGAGAMVFFRALLHRYLYLAGRVAERAEGIALADEPPRPAEQEDAFVRYYDKKFRLFGAAGKMIGKNAFPVRGKRLRGAGYGVVTGTCDAAELKAVARRYGCSITAYLGGLALWSIVTASPDPKPKEDPAVMIPINLRKVFPSETLKNFTSLIRCVVDRKTTPLTLEAYCAAVEAELRRGAGDTEELRAKLSLSALMGAKWYMKILPLFVKTAITKLGKLFSFKTKQTLILSNLGVIDLPESHREPIEKMTFNVNLSRKVPKNIGVVTVGGRTTVTFTRMICDTEVETAFFRRLREDGVGSLTVESNFREGMTPRVDKEAKPC